MYLQLAWEATKALAVNIGPLVFNFILPMIVTALSLIFLVIVAFTVTLMNQDSGGATAYGIITILVMLLAFLLIAVTGVLVGVANARIYLADVQGKTWDYRALLKDSRRFMVRFFVMQLLVGLIVVGGLFLFIIPGLIFAAWYCMAPYAMVHENLGPLAAMKRSRQLAYGQMWELFGLGSLVVLAAVTQFLPILNVMAYPVYFVLLFSLGSATAFRYLKATQLEGQPKPGKTNVVNYLLTALVPVLTVFVLALMIAWALVTASAENLR